MTRPFRKLSEYYLGPFKVMGKPSIQSYQVKLLQHLCAIDPVFHISQLEPAITSQIPNHENFPPSPIIVDNKLEYKIAKVLDLKLDYCRKPALLFYVYWAEYEGTNKEYSWLSALELDHA